MHVAHHVSTAPHAHSPPPSLVTSQHPTHVISKHASPSSTAWQVERAAYACSWLRHHHHLSNDHAPCHSTKKYKKDKYYPLDPFTVTTAPPALSLLTAMMTTACQWCQPVPPDTMTMMRMVPCWQHPPDSDTAMVQCDVCSNDWDDHGTMAPMQCMQWQHWWQLCHIDSTTRHLCGYSIPTGGFGSCTHGYVVYLLIHYMYMYYVCTVHMYICIWYIFTIFFSAPYIYWINTIVSQY